MDLCMYSFIYVNVQRGDGGADARNSRSTYVHVSI